MRQEVFFLEITLLKYRALKFTRKRFIETSLMIDKILHHTGSHFIQALMAE